MRLRVGSGLSQVPRRHHEEVRSPTSSPAQHHCYTGLTTRRQAGTQRHSSTGLTTRKQVGFCIPSATATLGLPPGSRLGPDTTALAQLGLPPEGRSGYQAGCLSLCAYPLCSIRSLLRNRPLPPHLLEFPLEGNPRVNWPIAPSSVSGSLCR